MLSKFFLLCLCALHTFSLMQQRQGEKIYFRNPSFEDPRVTATSACPEGWTSSPGSTPDIQPGAWGVVCTPHDGKSCVGLVTREDGTREDISQALSERLKKGNCYTFNLYLAHAERYVGYNQSVRLRVWGGSSKGAKEELLDVTPMISHTDWRNYKLHFTTAQDVSYITFEAYYAPGITFKYKGNLLLDLCSPIEKCDRA